MLASSKKQALSYDERSELFARERRLRPILRRIWLGVKIALLFGLIGGGWWAVVSGKALQAAEFMEEKIFLATSAMGLNLEHIYVQGGDHVREETIVARVVPEALSHYPEVPILALSTRKMKARLEGVGWVEEASISRRLPDSVYIHVKERTPVAIWQQSVGQGKPQFMLVDKDGHKVSTRDVKYYTHLPVIVGEDAPEHFTEIHTALAGHPALLKEVKSYIRVGGRRWNVRLKSGTEVKLPEENLPQALATLFTLDASKQLLARAVKTIDLRDPERVYVLPEATEELLPEETLELPEDEKKDN